MKKTIFTITLLFTFVLSINAQIKEGYLKYNLEVSSDQPEMAMTVSMMENSSMEIWFSKKAVRCDITMGTMMDMSTIVNNDSKDVLMLLGGMMGNTAVKTDIKTIESEDDEEEVEKPEIKFYNETKQILGYKCKKAESISKDGKKTTFWYTDKIEIATEGQSSINADLPGIALEYESNDNGLLMKFTVVDIDKKIKDKSVFSLDIPEGYNEMSWETFKSMGM
jgi:GLPGLI family protein